MASAIRPALLSLLVGALVFAWAVVRSTSSDAWLPIFIFVVPGAVLYAATLWLLGGLALSRTAQLDLRGWELAAWAWVPAGFLALSLLPLVAVFPVTSLIAGLLGMPIWHLAVVRAGLTVFAERRRRRSLLIYTAIVLAAPLTVIGVSLVALFAG